MSVPDPIRHFFTNCPQLLELAHIFGTLKIMIEGA
jgi:hypothetical protein